jgi:amino acid transporter
MSRSQRDKQLPDGNGQKPANPEVKPGGREQLPSESDANAHPPHHRVKIVAEPGDEDERELQSTPTYGGGYASKRPAPKSDQKVDPMLRQQEVVKGSHPGDKYVRYGRNVGAFRRQGGILSAQLVTEEPRGGWGRILYRIKRVLIGRPISTEQSIHERLTKVKALAVLSSDPLSSVAYATEEILRVLILAGLAGAGVLSLSLPIGLAIIILLAIVVTSYRQTIAAYPRGGGSYIVAKDNLGTLPGLTAAASILIDYTLTVAVSVSAGIAAIYSIFPEVFGIRVEICIGIVILLTIANLRGVRESGNIFALPTYLFIVGMLGLIAFGLARILFGIGGVPVYQPPPEVLPFGSQPLALFLILRAFTQGCTALTGVEAISDGVPAFKPPEAQNARTTLFWMGLTSITMFAGVTVLANMLGVRPSDQETVVSQIARTIFGSGALWYYIQLATALILVLAANTAFSDFPRLSYFLARDKFMPHQYSFRGDRLAFSWGIVTLAVLACVLILAFGGDTTALIPLYTIGVFASFTLSQSGMVRRWWRTRTPGWQRNLIINGLGAVTTGLVLFISAYTKFIDGAWIVLVLIPILIGIFLAINRHYRRVAAEVAELDELHPMPYKHTFIVPVSSLNAVTRTALNYARSLSENVFAVHIVEGEESEEAERFNQQWKETFPDTDMQLVIIESPYRSLIGPLLYYIDALDRQSPDDTITIVLPEFLPAKPWEYLLHNQSALRLKAALLFRPNTVVVDVPYHLGGSPQKRSAMASFPWVPLGVLMLALLLVYFFFLRR